MSPASRLAHIRDRIARAAKAAARDPAEITLIAVSKTRSVEQIEALIECGQRDFGESRVQEAATKWPVLRRRHPQVRLHMIGRLQSNKAVETIGLFDTIHSLDRPSLLKSLVSAQDADRRAPECFVQVNIGNEMQKGGVAPADLGDFIEDVRATPIPLVGLMAIPPLGQAPGPYFALLARLAKTHDLGNLSMGMSADFETAVLLGATHLRVGTALFES